MEGRGVLNYSTTKPSHTFTSSTTEFDDALIRRNVITLEESILAKGAAPNVARNLAQTRLEEERSVKDTTLSNFDETNNDSTNNYDSDEEKFKDYRVNRIKEIRLNSQNGSVVTISREAWKTKINEASADGTRVFVLLTHPSLTSTTGYCHGNLIHEVEEEIVPALAAKFSDDVKFVRIPAREAVPGWPDDRLPALLCYRYGTLEKKIVGLEEMGFIFVSSNGLNVSEPNPDILECKLGSLGLLDTDLECDPDGGLLYSRGNGYRQQGKNGQNDNGMHNIFDGGMSTLATGRKIGLKGNDQSEESDYYDVD